MSAVLHAGMTKVVRGDKYSVFEMTEDQIVAGTMLCFKNGRTVRRILCMDGDEVILRGCDRSSDIFEAVPASSVSKQWYRLEPVE